MKELREQLRSGLQAWAEHAGIRRDNLTRVFDLIDSVGENKPRWRRADQQPQFYIPDLRAQAWWDTAEFAWTEMVARNADQLVAECRRTRTASSLHDHPGGALVVEGNWQFLPLFTYGQRNEENCRAVPHTVSVIEQIPTASEASRVYLSSLAPHTTLKPHFGPTNCRVRCHIGISIPQDCWIRVGTDTRTWQTGRCIIFDDSFDHDVRNASDERRDVLIVDFWHPELSGDECRALRFVTKTLADRGILQER